MQADTPPADDARAQLHSQLCAILRTCDADRLARHLGLRSAAAADALRGNAAALERLARNLGDQAPSGDAALTLAAAHTLFPALEIRDA